MGLILNIREEKIHQVRLRLGIGILFFHFLLQLIENSADWVQKDHAKEQKTTCEISFGVANFKVK